MTKSQKRNARRKRAKVRGGGTYGATLHVNFRGLTLGEYHEVSRESSRALGAKGLLRAAELCRQFGWHIVREGQWDWVTTSHELFTAQASEISEVLTYASTQSFAQGAEICIISAQVYESAEDGQHERSYRWEIGDVAEVETVVADVVAAFLR